ncbi:2-C-methyl-D-erythritol 4-phosphate cytidylyltransferase [Ignavibacteria bacterium]|nr:2-C-methyl-D-erythritol 4-phosphate cytidylyltransferase [Bacteroidota bacterium]MCZ2131894.1 2-C-methyl-D-erythritol 4-phosphate cytidylyltransferase [Bacteroidota bacterium]
MKTSVIIASAGTGKRFGTAVPKQYLDLCGLQVIVRTLMMFENLKEINTIVVAVNPEWEDFLKNLTELHNLTKVADIVHGGAERKDSIANALLAPAIAEDDIILVHDAARPFATPDLTRRVIASAAEMGSAVPVIMPKDAVKQIRSDGFIDYTLERSNLRQAQTPQGFRAEILRAAYASAGNFAGVDDASLAEAAGFQVATVEGDERNIKITTPLDWSIARLILEVHSNALYDGTQFSRQ